MFVSLVIAPSLLGVRIVLSDFSARVCVSLSGWSFSVSGVRDFLFGVCVSLSRWSFSVSGVRDFLFGVCVSLTRLGPFA